MATGPLTINNNTTITGDLTVSGTNTTITGDLTVSGTIITTIDSSITGSDKTFTNTDSGKIFHVAGSPILTLPAYTTVDDGWCIGILNKGVIVTINCQTGDNINDRSQIFNTIKYTSVYIYKSSVSNEFIALGILY
jgi:hypothetical protein